MKRSAWIVIALLAIMVVSISGFAQAQGSPQGNLIAPPSTVGLRPGMVRTPLYIVKPDGIDSTNYPPNAETAGSVACIYGVTAADQWLSQERVSAGHGWHECYCRG